MEKFNTLDIIMSWKLADFLEQLWLSENESSIYITLLRLWSAVVWTIAKECQIPRTTTYQALDSLVEEWLVMKIDKWNILTYFPEEPERIVQNAKMEVKAAERKQELAEKLVPHLESLKNPYKQNPKVSYFEWIEWYKGLLNRALVTAKSTIRMISSSKTKQETLNWCKHEELIAFEQKDFLKSRLERNLDLKLLTTSVSPIQTDIKNLAQKERLTETRILPKSFWDTETIVVFWNSTIIVTDNFPIIWVHIEEEQTAIMMKNMFNFLWESSEKI